MKRINTIYISLILILSVFIILVSYCVLPKTEAVLPVGSLINKNKVAYLTFDDGPSENTIKILDILDKYEIQATFFVVGPSYKLKNDLLRKIVEKGHAIAIHSYNHEYSKIYASKESYIEDFHKCLNWIEKETNVKSNIYRFPGGSSTTIASKTQIQTIIDQLYLEGYTHADWNVDSYDSHYNNDTKAIINSTINCIKINESNKIYNQTILMHDNTKKIGTIEALPSIIEYLLSKEYQFKILTQESKLIQHVKRAT